MKNNSQEIIKIFHLDTNVKGYRLDQALALALPEFSRTQIKSWIMSGNLRVNNHCLLPKYKVQGGETVHLQANIMIHDEQIKAENIPLNLVYEDETFLIVNKPAGMVVHPAPGNRQQTLVNALLYHDANLALLPRAGIVHRLDKETSGVLLVAKTQDALKHLSKQLKKRTLGREYRAIVFGKLISGSTVTAPIGRHPLKRKQMAVIDNGKPAVTHYRLLKKYQHHTLISVQLETGRTHQIRVHMAHIQHPVLGDPLYNKRLQIAKNMTPHLQTAIRQFKRQALHAFALTLEHPKTQEIMRFQAELPDDMVMLCKLLEEDSQCK